MLTNRVRTLAGPWSGALLSVLLLLAAASGARAQTQPNIHLRYDSAWSPGTIGQYQLRGDLRRAGIFNRWKSCARGGDGFDGRRGAFTRPQPAPIKVGMQIGHAYRFQLTRVPLREGAEIFPTLEVIDRLHPPEGGKWRFPVPVQITMEEIDLALAGKYVTRVVYVEDPVNALAHHVDPRFQRYFEVRSDTDPLEVADQLGRPIAILRIGSRVAGRAADPVTRSCTVRRRGSAFRAKSRRSRSKLCPRPRRRACRCRAGTERETPHEPAHRDCLL